MTAFTDLGPELWRRLLTAHWRPLRLCAQATERWLDEGGPALGASIAFYTMFAVAPLLVVAIAIAGAVFGPDAARGHIVGEIQGLVGSAAAKSIEAMVESAWLHPHGLLAAVLGIVTLLLGASGVFSALRRALNAIGRVAPLPSAFGALVRARLIAFALVLGFGFLAVASLLVSAALAALGKYLSSRYPGMSSLFALFDVAVSTAVLVVAFFSLLRWLPDVPPSRHAVWIGAACSALLFAIGKHLIGLYLARASVASSYGAAGSFVVVMLWVYYSAQILLFGAALAATLDAHDGGGDAAARASGGPSMRRAPPPTSLAEARARRGSGRVRPIHSANNPWNRAPVKILRFPGERVRRMPGERL
ncbi:YihY/virulence factor BrkB family protein [Piscinibacter sp. XHJ-5]|uniref:YihY/virulence factor BrkB family protein n=1 Tax=Piscinibacter sp. XHJ-5 TaxID=3037797 RepID=UPI002452EE5D|nr:YihY/virulence factor BrkB family protein [Piscinibacter sp. XHJ-5]